MPKRILLAESNEVTREVAESALRQSGFEVISVSTAEKAKEVLQFTRPDLLVVSADLETAEQKPLYNELLQNKNSSMLPLLLLESTEGRSVTLPDEVVIRRPIDTRDFVKRVNVYLKPSADSTPKAPNPLDDEFLDSALGLDHLHITDAEDMDKSTIQRREKAKNNAGQMVGYHSNPTEDSDTTNGPRVESLIIEDDDSVISHKKKTVRPAAKLSGTGGLELATDQYGMTATPEARSTGSDNPQDYDSFLDSLRDESDAGAASKTENSAGSGGLKLSDTSSLLNPISIKNQTSGPKGKPTQSASGTGGIEQFIDEFKKEIEELRTDDPDEKEIAKPVQTGQKNKNELDWQDSVEMLEEEAVNLFVRQFATELANRVSKEIVAKLNGDKLLKMLKSVIDEQAQKGRR